MTATARGSEPTALLAGLLEVCEGTALSATKLLNVTHLSS
jgi:hypothetical protein